MPVVPATLALAEHYPVVASADVTGSIRAADPVDSGSFAAKWAYATAPADAAPSVAPGRIAALLPANPPRLPPSRPKIQVVSAAASVQLAELTPPAAAAPDDRPMRPPELPTGPANNVPITPPRAEKRPATQQTHNKAMPLLDPKSRTAIYDISARTVYLPNGEKLEAHSGLGDKLDDPRYVKAKNRGPTPPNVYDLTMREQLFHGVPAIRLNPVDEGMMHGRAGMLAHTYMLGASGQSNGCVSFKDYRKFLNAFRSGQVDRMVVVPNLGDMPSIVARARRGSDRRYADIGS
jgi:hypothetical protein